jgi:hypothetical protein
MKTELFHAKGGKDRRTNIKKLIVAFRSGSNMPKMQQWYVPYIANNTPTTKKIL